MNIVADEGVDHDIVQRLRKESHSVIYIAELSPSVPDDVVLSEANRLSAILLTSDKDFGELVFRQGRIRFGILLIRLEGMTAAQKADHVALAIREKTDEMANAFCVLSPGQLRIRKALGQ